LGTPPPENAILHADAVVDLDIVGVLSIVIFMRSGHRSIANLRVAIADIVSRS